MPTATENRTETAFQRRLGALDARTAARLIEISHALDLPAGRSVILEGDPADNIYGVQRGVVSVFKLLPDGRRQITGFLYPGDFLGVTFNVSGVYGYGAETVGHCTLRIWPRTALEKLFEEAPGVRRLFLAEMADELTVAQDRMLMLARRAVEERVANFLLTMARRQAGASGTRIEAVEVPMRWADIADYLGTTAETVSRTLSAFRDRGAIRTGKRHEIGIVDWAMLEAIAAGGRPQDGEIYR